MFYCLLHMWMDKKRSCPLCKTIILTEEEKDFLDMVKPMIKVAFEFMSNPTWSLDFGTTSDVEKLESCRDFLRRCGHLKRFDEIRKRVLEA